MTEKPKARTSEAAIQARRVLSELAVSHPGKVSIHDLARARGALVREGPIQCAEGWLVKMGSHGIIRVREGIPEATRKRFVIAHELGHFELHTQANQLALCLNEDLVDDYKSSNVQEIEANAYANEFLLPASLVSRHCREDFPDFERIRELAEEFDTSLMLTTMRLIDLTPKEVALVVSENGKIRWYRKSSSFASRIDPGAPVPRGSLAYSLSRGARPKSYKRELPDTVWLDITYDGIPESILLEECFYMASHSTVLSLLRPV